MSQTIVDNPKPDFPEKELIIGLQKRDKAACEQLYHRYSPVWYGVIFRITKDETLSNDLLQKLFLKLYQDGPNYDAERESIFLWIMRHCRKITLDVIWERAFKE